MNKFTKVNEIMKSKGLKFVVSRVNDKLLAILSIEVARNRLLGSSYGLLFNETEKNSRKQLLRVKVEKYRQVSRMPREEIYGIEKKKDSVKFNK